MKAKLSVVAAAGALAGIGAVWLAAHQHAGRPTEPGPTLTLWWVPRCWSAGWPRGEARPENRLGPVMVLTGFGWFAAQLSEASAPWLYTIGSAVQYVFDRSA